MVFAQNELYFIHPVFEICDCSYNILERNVEGHPFIFFLGLFSETRAIFEKLRAQKRKRKSRRGKKGNWNKKYWSLLWKPLNRGRGWKIQIYWIHLVKLLFIGIGNLCNLQICSIFNHVSLSLLLSKSNPKFYPTIFFFKIVTSPHNQKLNEFNLIKWKT